MDCGIAREALSAVMDGEAPGPAGLDAHLAACPACTTWQAQASRIGRLAAISAAEPGPDLTSLVLAGVSLPRPARGRSALRVALLVVAVAQVLVGAVELLATGPMPMMSMQGHVQHETSAFNLALGVVLLRVAADPARARAQLPLLASLVGVLAAISAVDLAHSSVGWQRLATHVPVLLGLLLTLVLSRTGTDRRSGTTRPRGAGQTWRLLMDSRTRRTTAVGALVLGGLLTGVGSAAAHVTAQPSTAAQGGFTKIAFRVPNEQDKAATNSVEVSLPADHPIASVATRALPGWTVKVDKSALAKPVKTDDGEVTEAVSKITWSGGRIGPGSFEDFEVSLGPLPTDTSTLVFKAIQTYDNGDVVRWIDTAKPGGAEPEHPAPTLALTPKATAEPVATKASVADSTSDSTGVLLGGIATVLAVVAAVFSVLAWRRSRESA
ncbi:DUF1775 domain-containing protein [Kutzneria albida]|uniref:Uncharacterized protein n=1 Tax=Kutzneria albida DSM 43870 TaxID=1449976 RepID=W5WBB5_9PSEU|nr:DUF1775 domain-containing protein [Kutzneria albida]AHH95514.1 hypothetical protein KALB_2145 [Kutzneria albida DSM 43870]